MKADKKSMFGFKVLKEYQPFLKRFNSLSKLSIVQIRTLYILGSILYPFWGWLYEKVSPGSYDSVPFRMIFMLPVIIGLIYSFTPFGKRDLRRLNMILNSTACLIAIQSFYFAIMNNLSRHHLAGGFAILFVLSTVVSHWLALILLYVISISAGVLSFFYADQEVWTKIFFLLGLTLTSGFGFYSVFYKMIITKKLFDNEEKLHHQEMNMLVSSKMAMLGEISANIMHEIKNPLGIMQLNLDFQRKLHQDLSPILGIQSVEKLEKSRDKISENLKRINIIIDNLKSYSNTSNQEILFDEIELSSFLSAVQEIASIKANKVSAKLEIKNTFPHIKFVGQYVPLYQVITNLINNAFDAIEFLSEKWVVLHVFEEGENICFTVALLHIKTI